MADFEAKGEDAAMARFTEVGSGNMPGGVVGTYAKWAKHFDEDAKAINIVGGGTKTTAEAIGRLCGGEKDAHILDLCAGTGFVGAELHKLGYKNLDALDSSKEMLDVAEKKGLYKKYVVHLVGGDRLPFDDNSYDGLVCSDGFLPGHIEDGACFSELARIVKPGGGMAVLFDGMHMSRFEADLEKMQDEGKWKYEVKKCDYTPVEGEIPATLIEIIVC